jgi:hypothetical protein
LGFVFEDLEGNEGLVDGISNVKGFSGWWNGNVDIEAVKLEGIPFSDLGRLKVHLFL